MKILILDDDDFRHAYFVDQLGEKHDVTITHTYDECIAALALKKFDCVLLDHDLNNFSYESIIQGPECDLEANGMDVCRFLISMPRNMWPRQVIVHSKNTQCGNNMASELRCAGIQHVIRWEFDPNVNLLTKKVRG
jgi:CheY-like chemotaxis protein